jgi:hypothetical protein
VGVIDKIAVLFLLLLSLSTFAESSLSVSETQTANCLLLQETSLKNFSDQISSIAVKNENFLTQILGYELHKSCIEHFGAEFPGMIDESIKSGFSCLKSLKGPAAKRNLEGLQANLGTHQLKVFCNEKDYHWATAAAHGSRGEIDNKADLELIHPFVSINPNYTFSENGVGIKESPFFIKRVFFHELFHNIGYAHGETVDYAFACEDCCGTNISNEGRLAACKVCQSEYKGADDPQYIQDLNEWVKFSPWSTSIGAWNMTRRALQKHPGPGPILESFLASDSDLNLLTQSFGRLLVEQNLTHSPVAEELASRIFPEELKEVKESVDTMARARIEILMKGNSSEALKVLQTLDQGSIKKFLKEHGVQSTEYLLLKRVWDAVLYDIEFLQLNLDKSSAEYKDWQVLHYQILHLID